MVDQDLHDIYLLAMHGETKQLQNYLSTKPRHIANLLINQMIIDDNNGDEKSPFLVAIRFGEYETVEMLLNEYEPDLEQEGKVKLNNGFIQNATPLWFAIVCEHLDIIKCLVEAGADINHVTDNIVTPVWMACCLGRLDIVKYLTKNNTNELLKLKYNHLNIMIAEELGHLDIVNCLYEN